MDAIIGRINQLTHEGAMPANKITVAVDVDTSAIDEAQQKADKLKATLLEVQELIRQTNVEGINLGDKIISGVTKEINRAIEYSRLVQGKHPYGGNEWTKKNPAG